MTVECDLNNICFLTTDYFAFRAKSWTVNVNTCTLWINRAVVSSSAGSWILIQSIFILTFFLFGSRQMMQTSLLFLTQLKWVKRPIYVCVFFAPELVHVWIYNMEGTWVLPLSLLCALGDPHIVLFVIIHLVDFLCYVTSFFLWKTELYTWTCWMQHMRWEAIINKTIHLCLFFFFFFYSKQLFV